MGKPREERMRYFTGAPLRNKDRVEALEKIREEPPEIQNLYLSNYLNRVNDKTAGVLTISGVVFAILMFVLDKASKSADAEATHSVAYGTNGAIVFCAIGILLSWTTIFMLCWNLKTVWRANLKPTPKEVDDIFHLFCTRAIRLQISLYGIALAAFLSVIALGMLEWQLIAHAFQPASAWIWRNATSVLSHIPHVPPKS